MCVCVCACVRACVRACVCACVCVCEFSGGVHRHVYSAVFFFFSMCPCLCAETGLGLVGYRYCAGDVILKRAQHLFTFSEAKILCGSANGKVLGPIAHSNNCTIGLLTSKMRPAWINQLEDGNLHNAYLTDGLARAQDAKQLVVCELRKYYATIS